MNQFFSKGEIQRFREETPGTNKVTHFNHAGASLMLRPVYDAVTNYLQNELLYGGYETAAKCHQDLEKVYVTIGQFINADPTEIAITENATMAWQMAFHSIPLNKGDNILTAQCSYASNYISYLQVKEKFGIDIRVVPNDEFGQINLREFENFIDSRTKLISVVHIPTNSGVINPVHEIGKIANKYQIPFLLDACQSVGQVKMDVQEIGCDILSTTGRKYLRGPRGTGFLYVKKSMLDKLVPPFLNLHAATWTSPQSFQIREDARRFENWETFKAGKLGLGRAVSYANEVGIRRISNQIIALATHLREKLSDIKGVKVWDIGRVKGGIVTFSINGIEAYKVKQILTFYGINVSVSEQAATLLDTVNRELPPLIRASVHYYTTEEEIDHLVNSVYSLSIGRVH